MIKLKEFKILSEQQEEFSFSLKFCKSKSYTKWIRTCGGDTSWLKGIRTRQDHEMKIGVNNAGNEWAINIHFMFISPCSATSLEVFLNLGDFTKSCSKASSLLENLIFGMSAQPSGNQHLPLSRIYFVYSSWLVLQTFPRTTSLPFKLTISADWCFLLNDLVIPCCFLPSSTFTPIF